MLQPGDIISKMSSCKKVVDDTVMASEASGSKREPTAISGDYIMYGRSLEDLDGNTWKLYLMDINAIFKEYGVDQN